MSDLQLITCKSKSMKFQKCKTPFITDHLNVFRYYSEDKNVTHETTTLYTNQQVS